MTQKRAKQSIISNSLALAILITWAAVQCAQAETAAENRIPVQAELVQALEAGRTKVGDPVFARVETAWKNPACTLRKGAIVKGRVVSQKSHSKADKSSEIALLFENGQCGGRDMKVLPLTLVAVVAPDPTQGNSLFENQQSPPLSDAVGLGLNGDTAAITGNGMRSITAAAQTVFFEPQTYKPPKAVLPGQVVGIAHVKLSVGSGPEGSSILSASGRNVRLDSGSQLVLVPNLSTTSAAANPKPAGSSAVSIPETGAKISSTAEIADTTEICAPPECSIALPASDTASDERRAALSVSVKELGYLPPSAKREMDGFEYGAAIAYLGPEQLLFTFDPHELIPRAATESSLRELRIIRGVVIDLKTNKVVKSVDWRVADVGQYLWPLGDHKVLIHVGDDLRVYGRGLRQEKEISLDGPLAFVRISPSSTYFAVGVVHERYTPEIRRQLEAAEGREPEEDVQVRVLDANFRTLTTVMRSSREAPPILMDEGEIRIPTIGENRWRIVEYSWAGQRHVLAQVDSTCVPQAKSLANDFLFVIGCDRRADGRWYRILRANGRPILKGWSSSAEIEQNASGSQEGEAFAVGIVSANKSLPPQSYFYTTDLQNQQITVYRADDGRRLFSAYIPTPIPTLQSFTLSPDGNQLAVLVADQIQFYTVPANAKPH
jgi:hypothetical protein